MAKNDQTNQRSMQVDLAAHAKRLALRTNLQRVFLRSS